MPTFDFIYQAANGGSLTQDGPIIPIEVAMPNDLRAFYASKGQLAPAPQTGYALIDTGASITSADDEVLKKLSISEIDEIPCAHPLGEDRALIHPVSISFPALEMKDLSLARVLGCKLKWKTTDNKEITMLLGRDLLKDMIMFYNGKAHSITVAF